MNRAGIEVGDKVECIDLGEYPSLTIGKVYRVEIVGYTLVGLVGHRVYPNELFKKAGETE